MMEKDNNSNKQRGGRSRFGGRRPEEKPEFDQKIIDLARVTRVMAGGKRMRFRACVVIGDKKGRLGMGLAKGKDVTLSVNKAVNKAKKNMIKIPIVNGTIPHNVYVKFKAAKILLKPAPSGTGLKAGGAMRMALELSGISDIVGKIIGGKSKINTVTALMRGLSSFKYMPKDKKQKVAVAGNLSKPEQATVTAEEKI
ncbi:MAG: 30S ribosomal protein S5 [Parcubacteria group bacterium]